jgi:hypothetical protein
MGDSLSKLIDVTIHYPKGIPSYWDFVCGRVNNIVIDIKVIEISELLRSKTFSADYFTDPEKKQIFQDWLNNLWQQKDQSLDLLNKQPYNK